MASQKTYRYRNLKPGDPYLAKWRLYRLRRMIIIVPVFLFPIASKLFDFDQTYLVGIAYHLPPLWEIILGGLLAIIIALSLLSMALRGMARCPRCNKFFDAMQRRWTPENLYYHGISGSMECPHCGLPKWAPDDPDKGAE